MQRRQHFVTGDFRPRATHLDDTKYGRMLDNLVIACVDSLLLCQGKILLGQRVREPQADWWIIGGRMRPGESFEETAARKCREELRLNIAPSRFHYLTTTSLVFAKRAQPPQHHGCHTISVTMWANITPRQAARIHPNDEYRAVRWQPLRQVMGDRKLHPALRQRARDVLAGLKKRSATARLT